MSMTVEEARAEATRRWVNDGGQVPTRAAQVNPAHRAKYPVVKAEGPSSWAVGYCWHTPYSHHLSGKMHDRIMGHGATLEQAFQRAEGKKATAGPRDMGIAVRIPARVVAGLVHLTVHAESWLEADGWETDSTEDKANMRAALKWVDAGGLRRKP